MQSLEEILEERGSQYGDFMGHSEITQGLKSVIIGSTGYERLQLDQMEALDMIFHKIGRIINGNPNHVDSWQDIAGYSQLIVNRLQQNEEVPF
jgi:hypothetical protein